MANYRYQVRSGAGQIQVGVVSAESVAAAAGALRTQGMHVLSLTPIAAGMDQSPLIAKLRELKSFLREERSGQFTRAVAHHMLTYALGRPLDASDRPRLDAIHRRFEASGYRLRDLVLAIVEDEAFRR